MTTAAATASHAWFEDLQALLIGGLFVAVSVLLLREAGLLTGGTAGLAFLGHYLSGQPFGAVFFALNLPCYLFAWRAMGPVFTVKTFAAVSLLSVYSEWLPRFIRLDGLDPAFAAVLAGLLAGTGLLILVRHRASLGGIGVLALYLQDKRGWRAGQLQMAADGLILCGALLALDGRRVLLSVLGAAAMNLVIAVNHRPGRYTAI
ncbi:YitT family protein [Chitinimonas koreensis]|uniref:YitT family protein n=1 Tax=Chitinimonas koreensis TaxID=356302 RepID=UPI00041F5262|nr:YitT family protein [Chitinimonas koreensis]QNM95143.1 YitT family protein [Chitinimonas koreensis]